MEVDDILYMGAEYLLPGRDYAVDSVTAELYHRTLKISICRLEKGDLEFDVVGIYPGLINALRRILISEIPTMAIEKVHIFNNTSVIQDEVLAQRLGLIPLRADARFFEYHNEALMEFNDKDSLLYELNIKCTKNPNARVGRYRNEDKYLNFIVYSSDIKWKPLTGQESLFKADLVLPVHNDIVIAKLRPGQEIQCDLIAVKGIGLDHAKFSPVGTASYRLHPYVELKEEIEGDAAVKLQSCFSPGVIGLKNKKGKSVASVENARLDMCSRNHLRYDEFRNKVVTGRIPDHYIVTVESCVGLGPDELVKEAIKVLKKKCQDSLICLKDLLS